MINKKKILFKYARFMQFLGSLEVGKKDIDACPGTVLESLLSGTPVLGVRESISEELIEENLAGISVSSLNEAQQRLPELLALNPLKIREWAIKKYNPEVMVERYISLYEKILNENLA